MPEFIITAEAADALLNRRIFLGTGDRPRLGARYGYEAGLKLPPYVTFLGGGRLWRMGSFSYSGSVLPLGTEVGRYCSIARNVSVPGPRYPIEAVSTSPFVYSRSSRLIRSALIDFAATEWRFIENPQPNSVVIGHDVWIGEGAVILPNVSIGHGAVIATNADVTKTVPAYAVVAGNPGVVKRMRFDDKTIESLMLSRWWEYKFVDLPNDKLGDPCAFAYKVCDMRAAERLAPYNPELFAVSSLSGEADALPPRSIS